MSRADRHFLRRRADFLDAIRRFFRQRDVVEVDTPLLASTTASDPLLDSFDLLAGDQKRYLLTSPEHAMKRLLAAGSGAIFQLGRAFRRGELGARHNPEFTLLEWYRPGFSLVELEAEVLDLLRWLALPDDILSDSASASRLTYREAFVLACGLDPFAAPTQDLCRLASTVAHLGEESLRVNGAFDRDLVLDLLVVSCLEPWLQDQGCVFLTEFPASQAALAVVAPDAHGTPVARRFELYLRGMEIANAYEELSDPREQRRRFEADNLRRRELGRPSVPIDERLLDCLRHLPPCAGIALGVDRLFMVKEGVAVLEDAVSFAWQDI